MVKACVCGCVCVFMASGEVMKPFPEVSCLSVKIPEIKSWRGEKMKKPRAVLASDLFSYLSATNPCVNEYMASKVKA